MAEVRTSRPILLRQLVAELGASARMVGPNAGETIVRSDVAQDALESGIALHEPNPVAFPLPPPSTEEANAATVGQQLDAALANLSAIIDTADLPAGTLTAAQLSNAVRQLQTAVKVLARNQRRLIRWGLNRFDGAD